MKRVVVEAATPVVCEGVSCTWAQFLEANADVIQGSYADEIRKALERNGHYSDGGGAWASWTIRLAEPAS